MQETRCFFAVKILRLTQRKCLRTSWTCCSLTRLTILPRSRGKSVFFCNCVRIILIIKTCTYINTSGLFRFMTVPHCYIWAIINSYFKYENKYTFTLELLALTLVEFMFNSLTIQDRCAVNYTPLWIQKRIFDISQCLKPVWLHHNIFETGAIIFFFMKVFN